MLFSETERRELAEFFAKRFSDPSVRSMLARQAGVDDPAKDATPDVAWERLITTAQTKRRLPHLAVVASRTDQTDQNLQAVCNLLGARARIVRTRLMTATAAASVALGFGVLGWHMGANDTAPVVAEAEIVAPIEVETVAAVEPIEEVVEVPVVEEEPQPKIDLSGPGYITSHKKPKLVSNGPAWKNGRCTHNEPGDFVGYYYAGKDLPGRQGETIEIKMGVNVRSEYPGNHNNFNKRGIVRCILKRGDMVKLTDPPILVPGDRFWIPLYHGDIVKEVDPPDMVAIR
ncbi:MAG: hypothetical protein CL930_11090 [Deltaproteobacteria bacterium]|nr:hypothetical protein [Deltaproteobacteria bacterium]